MIRANQNKQDVVAMKKLIPLLLLLAVLIGITPAQAASSFVYQTNTVNSGQAFKVPVQAATTGAINLTGSQTIDGVAVTDHTTDGSGKSPDRVLVKNQSDQTTNGIYTVNSGGTWARAPDFQGINNVVTGTQVTVNAGTQAGFWTVTAANPVVIGNSGITVYAPSNITFAATQIPVPQNLALASGNLFVGNSFGSAASVPLSGDCSLSNTGGITCTKSNGVNLSSAATAVETDNLCLVGIGGIWQAGSCTGPSGSGTVNVGTSTHLGYYATSTNVISSNSFLTVGTTGILSATGFSGPLTGNVTGNSTGIHSGSLASTVTATTQSPGDNSTKIVTTAYLANAATRGPTIITATGSGTFTTPAGTYMLHVRGCSAGGGGAGGGATVAGAQGGTTSFGTGGALGNATGGSSTITGSGQVAGGTGGIATNGDINVNGNPGEGITTTGTQITISGGNGGGGPFGGAGLGGDSVHNNGGAASPNSCAGGGGGVGNGSSAGPGPGGGAGAYFEKWITSPAASYPYTIGAKGGISAGTVTTGGAAADGELIIEAF